MKKARDGGHTFRSIERSGDGLSRTEKDNDDIDGIRVCGGCHLFW